jgi:hypothetical protein
MLDDEFVEELEKFEPFTHAPAERKKKIDRILEEFSQQLNESTQQMTYHKF